MENPRNYATISPSAKALLLMKGYTDIPYAREAATLMSEPEPYIPDYSIRSIAFWARVYHFENRYRSIDQLLSDLHPSQVLELSSGFSFRGLAMTRQASVHYIDTDLPEVIGMKQAFVERLAAMHDPAGGDAKGNDKGGGDGKTPGRLELLALNALDEAQFAALETHLTGDELVIVNEGLLMYLGIPEKEQLCRSIHRLLSGRGGCWITADAYVRRPLPDPSLEKNDELHTFFQEHHIEENKFGSFEEAASFFDRMGFVIEKEAGVPPSSLSTYPYLIASASPEILMKMRDAGKVNATWRLRLKG